MQYHQVKGFFLFFFVSCPNILPWSLCYKIQMCLFDEGRSNMFLVKTHFNIFLLFCLWPSPSFFVLIFFLPVYVYHSLTIQTFSDRVSNRHSLATGKFTFGASFKNIFHLKKYMLSWWLYNSVNILKNIEKVNTLKTTLNWWIVCYVNYVPRKLLKIKIHAQCNKIQRISKNISLKK